jgi:hypothetical protein
METPPPINQPPKVGENKRSWWTYGCTGALAGGFFPPMVLIGICAVSGDYGGRLFLPIVCIPLFVIGALGGLLIGTIAWAIITSKTK